MKTLARRLGERPHVHRLQDVLEHLAAATRSISARCSPRSTILDEPGAGSPDVDHAELPRRGREHRLVAEVRRERRPCVRLLGGVQVDLGGRGVNPSPRPAWRSAWPTQAASSVAGSFRSTARRRTRAAGSAARSSCCGSRRGRAAERDVQVEGGISERLGECSSDRPSSRSPGQRSVAERVVAGYEEVEPLLRRGRLRQGDLHDSEHLLGRVGRQRGRGGLGRELHADLRVAGGPRVMREEQQRLRRRLAGEQEVDDRGVDLSPAGASVSAANSRTCSCGKL